MAPGPVVRRGGPDDLIATAALRWRWRVEEGPERPAVTLEAFTTALGEWLADHAATHRTFVAEVEGDVVGIGWLAVVHRIPGPEVWDRRAGLVQALYVVPEARDQGIGGALLDAMVAHAREIGLQYLGVHPSERSVPFYRRRGFGSYERGFELRF
ncbi:MAG: GNAT family N-acetyltransferase [Acidimicrobiales bacterium]